MLRSLYRCALRLHPRAFRQHFGDEMLSIFDLVNGRLAAVKLLMDALVSLSRQWMLRPEFWHEASPAVAPLSTSDGVPSFYTIRPFRPRSAAFIHGLFISFAVFCVTCFAIRYSWIHVLHVHIPEVQFERPSWIPPSHTTSGMNPSLPLPPLAPPPGRNRAQATVAVTTIPAVEQAPPPAAIVSRRRSARVSERSGPAKPQNNPQMSDQGLRAQAEIEPPLHVYEGTYAVEAPVRLTIVITANPEDESLRMSLSGQPKLTLEPLSETKFEVQGIDNCWIEFAPGDSAPGSPVRQLEFLCNGQHYLAYRR